MPRTFLPLLFAFVMGPVLAAQSQRAGVQASPSGQASDAMLVFDASGSMWGQIDGKAKITIAREVVQGLLNDLPPERRLGLVAYGHRNKGDCKDIQTLVPVGTDRAAISKAVAGINPKGKTPMTAAVEQAAEALKFTENKATVILVSDGMETCNADPCAVAARLEQLGIGLTVHTIGFGLTQSEAGAKDQLRCMAEATGGRFFEADDAAELREALSRVSRAEPALADTVEVTMKATDQEGGPLINKGLVWTVRHGASGEVIYTSEETGTAHAELPRGVHDVSVRRVSDGATGEGRVNAADQTRLTLPIVVELAASVKAPQSAAAGSKIRVVWEGPDEANDYISVAKPGSAGGSYVNFTYTKHGNPLELVLPSGPGEYEVRYVSHKTRTVLARRAINVTEIEASLEIPATARAGATITVNWTGPDYAKDYISVAKAGSSNRSHENHTYTREGTPLQLLMPAEPGDYEVRYIQSQGRTVLVREPITITAVDASVDAPASAAAGATITVNWTGPDYAKDYISVAKAGSSNRSHENHTYTREGTPLQLLMPAEPGDYEVRYIQSQGRTVLVREPITITAVDASVDAPATAAAGATITVNWTGPDYAKDYISVAKAGSSNRSHENHTYTSKGNPLELRMPSSPGAYEIRYIQSQKRTVLTRKAITVTP